MKYTPEGVVLTFKRRPANVRQCSEIAIRERLLVGINYGNILPNVLPTIAYNNGNGNRASGVK